MMKIVYFLIILFFTTNISAFEIKQSNASFGFSGSYGLHDMMSSVEGETDWKSGTGYGIGFIFEKMFTGRFGISSGINLTYAEIKVIFLDSPDITVENTYLNYPFLLITSFNIGSFSINILTGITIMHMLSSNLVYSDIKADKLNDISYIQLGISGGLNLKYKISTFTDYFLGGLSEFYLNNFIPKGDNGDTHYFSHRLITGFMFRTNI